MADSVPDPDDVMEADVHDMIADEPDEPFHEHEHDSFFIDGNNANRPDEDFPDRESTPVPEEAVPGNCFDTASPDLDGTGAAYQFTVNTAAVDIETINLNYSGVALFERLQFIIDHCPPLKRDAVISLINALQKDSLDTTRYSNLHTMLEHLDKNPHEQSVFSTPIVDQMWIDQIIVKASARLELLHGEYKKQKDEGVKESTRRAMEDLFQHYLVSGKYSEGLKLLSRGMREYCSQFKHIIQMWLSWLELTICVGEWTRVEALVAQAERSIADAEEAENVANGSNARGRAAVPVVSGTKNNRQLISNGKAKLDAISGLYRLYNRRFKMAADKLVKVDVDQLDLPWLLHPSDIAIYAVLSVLASYDRLDIKKVLSDPTCRKFLEAEPQLVELLQCFVGSQFGRCFDVLASLKDKFLLDPFIAPVVNSVFSLIRRKAMVQYLIPFASSRLDAMAELFRTTIPELEDELVSLIENDELCARIDSVGGMVRRVETDPRQHTYKRIIETCDSMLQHTEVTILRAVIQQGRMSVTSEPRNKRKGVHNSEDASDPVSTPNRQKVTATVQGMMQRAFKGPANKNLLPSEADSSEGSEDPREPRPEQ